MFCLYNNEARNWEAWVGGRCVIATPSYTTFEAAIRLLRG